MLNIEITDKPDFSAQQLATSEESRNIANKSGTALQTLNTHENTPKKTYEMTNTTDDLDR